MKLVIVETPAQAKSLTQVLGDGWHIEPCSGFVRDLPADRLGIDIDDDFRPAFALVPASGIASVRLMKAIREAKPVHRHPRPVVKQWHEPLRFRLFNDQPISVKILLYTDTIMPLSLTASARYAPGQAEITQRIINRRRWSAALRATRRRCKKRSLHGMTRCRCWRNEKRIAATFPRTRNVPFTSRDGGIIAQVLIQGPPLALRRQTSAQLETCSTRHVLVDELTGIQPNPYPPLAV